MRPMDATRLADSERLRHGWTTVATVACLVALVIAVIRDLFLPESRPVAGWFGVEFIARLATAPLHWAICALGAWGFRMLASFRADDSGEACRRALAVLALVAALVGGAPAPAAGEEPGRIERIEARVDGSAIKVFVMLSRPLPFDVRVLGGEATRKSARRLVLDFADATIAAAARTPVRVDSPLVHQVRTGEPATGTARVVLDLADDTRHSVEAYETPPHVTIVVTRASAGPGAAAD